MDRMPPSRPARQNRGASRDYRLRLPCRAVRSPSSTSNARLSAQCLPHGKSCRARSQRASSGGRRIGTLGPPCYRGDIIHKESEQRAATALPQPTVDHVMFHGTNRGRIGYAPNLASSSIACARRHRTNGNSCWLKPRTSPRRSRPAPADVVAADQFPVMTRYDDPGVLACLRCWLSSSPGLGEEGAEISSAGGR